jgi:hypothetical protein
VVGGPLGPLGREISLLVEKGGSNYLQTSGSQRAKGGIATANRETLLETPEPANDELGLNKRQEDVPDGSIRGKVGPQEGNIPPCVAFLPLALTP